jgi:hypothetical protein
MPAAPFGVHWQTEEPSGPVKAGYFAALYTFDAGTAFGVTVILFPHLAVVVAASALPLARFIRRRRRLAARGFPVAP